MIDKSILRSPDRLNFLEQCFETVSVMPLVGITKDPKYKGWRKYSTRIRPSRIEEFYNCNAAFITGPASDLWILDEDNVPLFESYKRRYNKKVPSTYTVATGRGYHKYFLYPKNGKRHGNKSIPTIGVDFRGDGGYALAPYSIHEETGKVYTVVDPRPPVPAPQWLLDFYEKGTPSKLKSKNIEKLR